MAAGDVTFTPNTYAGEVKAGFMATSLLEGTTVQRGLITVQQNVKKRLVIRSIDIDVVFQDPSCSFVAGGADLPIVERYLDPVAYEIGQEICFKDLRQSWDSQSLQAGSLNDYTPTTELSDFWVGRVMEKTKNLNDKLYWLGKGSDASAFTFTDDYDGLLAKFEAGSDVFKIAMDSEVVITGITKAAKAAITVSDATAISAGDILSISEVVGMVEMNGLDVVVLSVAGSVITVNVDSTAFTTYTSDGIGSYINQTNVNTWLSTVYGLIPDALRMHDDLKIYIPFHIERAYKFAQAEVTGAGGNDFVTDKELNFLGNALEPMPYFDANTIVVARVSNLFLAVDLLGDESTLETIDLRKTTGDKSVRLIASMKTDTNFQFGSEILYLRPA